ncbi:hypothetical protein DPEC_G00361840 [Dallia pectoralis]|nr:hypothetical protein DPEC_G00361840 [Dallia pectoralis]
MSSNRPQPHCADVAVTPSCSQCVPAARHQQCLTGADSQKTSCLAISRICVWRNSGITKSRARMRALCPSRWLLSNMAVRPHLPRDVLHCNANYSSVHDMYESECHRNYLAERQRSHRQETDGRELLPALHVAYFAEQIISFTSIVTVEVLAFWCSRWLLEDSPLLFGSCSFPWSSEKELVSAGHCQTGPAWVRFTAGCLHTGTATSL